MPLPSGLTAYEFERQLIPSRDTDKFYHLHVTKTPEGVPKLMKQNLPAATPIETDVFFNQKGPIEVEIGCGKGGFMVEYCELNHTRVVLGEVFYFFRDFLPDNSVGAFHMYFPDPWPKKKHRKRRLLNNKFLEQVHRISTNNALFCWATDHQNYHKESWELFTQQHWIQVVNINAGPTEGIMTNFEKKYRVQGREIFRTVFRIVK
jgi:tRNA (guanine-N7-)-methyltransferase